VTWAHDGQRVTFKLRKGNEVREVPAMVQVACGRLAHVVNPMLGIDKWLPVEALTAAPLPVPAAEDMHFMGCCDDLTDGEEQAPHQ
jgi:hypothetical protein